MFVVVELNAVCIWLLVDVRRSRGAVHLSPLPPYSLQRACGSSFACIHTQCCKCTACKPQVSHPVITSAPRPCQQPTQASARHAHNPPLNGQLLCHLLMLHSTRGTRTAHAAAGRPWWKKPTPKSTTLCRIGNCCRKCAVRLPRAIQACVRGAAQEQGTKNEHTACWADQVV